MYENTPSNPSYYASQDASIPRPAESKFQPYIERLHKALARIDDKTKPIQLQSPDKPADQLKTQMTQLESSLDVLVEIAERLAREINL